MLDKFLALLSRCFSNQEVVEPTLHEVLLKPNPLAAQPNTLIEGGYKGGRERRRSSDGDEEVWHTYSAESADSATYQDTAASPVVQPGVELPDNDNKGEETWQDYPIASNGQGFFSQSPFTPHSQPPSTAFEEFMTSGASDHNYGWYTQ